MILETEKQRVQISSTIDRAIQQKIVAIAEKENRSFSQMVEIILREAISKKKK